MVLLMCVLNDIYRLSPGRKILIRKGLFHSTKAVSSKGAMIFEIETPVDKHDIVRLEDKYGRTANHMRAHHLKNQSQRIVVGLKNLI